MHYHDHIFLRHDDAALVARCLASSLEWSRCVSHSLQCTRLRIGSPSEVWLEPVCFQCVRFRGLTNAEPGVYTPVRRCCSRLHNASVYLYRKIRLQVCVSMLRSTMYLLFVAYGPALVICGYVSIDVYLHTC